ncbi:MAG: hypothetical protein RBR08_11480 [Desulforegulaceae bacterium]|nr:hypothetical protein [Desulforegulaceae bacterium]
MNPPEKSRFKTYEIENGIVLEWYDCKKNLSDIGGFIFLIIWLCGWAVGELFAFSAIISDRPDPGAKIFLIIWLSLWTFAGIGAFLGLINILRPSVPSKLIFYNDHRVKFVQGTYKKTYLDSDGGKTSVNVRKGRNFKIFEKDLITNVKLERIGERQKLSFDYESKRIEIGKGLEESEREWLFEKLKS